MKRKPISLRVPEDLKREIAIIAQDKGISVNALITQTLWKHFKENKN